MLSSLQESELGSWHVPLEEKSGDERIRIWLCIGRARPGKESDEAPVFNGVVSEVPPTEAYNGVRHWLPENRAESAAGKRKGRD
jgi:proteinaceous RNase P